MYAIATFLIVAAFTLVFGRLATGALIATGVPPDIASFQARSAFSGTGFTTPEAENVINHKLRRQIIMGTMFVGSLGTPTLIVAVLVGFVAPGPGSTTERTLVVISGLILITLFLGNRPSQRLLVHLGHRYANKRLLRALEDAPEELLALGNSFVVGAVTLRADPVDTYRSIKELDDAFPGVKVLGVRRGETYFGESQLDIQLRAGDELIVHAHADSLNAIGDQMAG